MGSLDSQEGRLKTWLPVVGQKKMGRRETKEGRMHSFGQRWRAGHSPSTLETMSIADGQKMGRLAPHTNSSGGGEELSSAVGQDDDRRSTTRTTERPPLLCSWIEVSAEKKADCSGG